MGYIYSEIKKEGKESLRFLCIPAVICILVAVVLTFIRPVFVSGDSMEHTYHDGQILFATHMLMGEIKRGDIVVAKPGGYGEMLIKRVIATGGDTFEIRRGKVYINNEELIEDYLPEQMQVKEFPAVTLQEGEYFLMGDNRNYSCDSRELGVITRKEIVYKIVGKRGNEQTGTEG